MRRVLRASLLGSGLVFACVTPRNEPVHSEPDAAAMLSPEGESISADARDEALRSDNVDSAGLVDTQTEVIDATTDSGVGEDFSNARDAANAANVRIIPVPRGPVYSMTLGPDGNIWYVETFAPSVFRMTLENQFTEFPIPGGTVGAGPIISGPDGNLWVADGIEVGDHGSLLRLTPDGDFTRFRIPDGPVRLHDEPCIAPGPDSNLYFVLSPLGQSSPGGIGTIDMRGEISTYVLPDGDEPTCLAPAPNGDIWFASDQRIGRLKVSGQIDYFPVRIEEPGIYAMVRADDGNVWFLESRTGVAGRISSSGEIDYFELPSVKVATTLVTGPNGDLWYLAYAGNIGRLKLTGERREFSDAAALFAGAQAFIVTNDGTVWIGSGGRIIKVPL